MKYLFCFFAVFQLAAAVIGSHFLVPAVVDNTTINSCPPKENQETAIQGLMNSTVAISSKIWMIPQCGDGFWYQVLGINMSTADSQCPSGWVEENSGGVRACGRGTVGGSCQSAILNVIDYQMEYTKVCGRAIGYQYRSPDAFHRSNVRTLEQNYVDGLSITYGTPRQHLWTFAAGVREGPGTPNNQRITNCPCSNVPGPGAPAPSYVGNNWYCESGNPNGAIPSNIAGDDPLWDGDNCEGTCCSNGKSPPWFSVELPGPTSDDIEARICADEHSNTNEDIFISLFEIYIQ